MTTAPSNALDSNNISGSTEFEALNRVISALQPLDDEARQRIIEAAVTFLKVHIGSGVRRVQSIPATGPATVSTPHGSSSAHAPFSENTEMSPKDFLLEKQPRTDVERIACLAYYLTHYRGTPHFKTIDLSMLNTEAAQPKFANAANSSNNAVKMGYLVPSSKGQRQLSAVGERFVRALPDRDAARAALESFRRRPRAKRTRQTIGENEET